MTAPAETFGPRPRRPAAAGPASVVHLSLSAGGSRLSIEARLLRHRLDPRLRALVAQVLAAIDPAVRDDLIEDRRFFICEVGPGEAATVPIGSPGAGRPGRAVLLKRSLLDRPGEFARWVVAHELAHAHLRNAGRFDGEDPEAAADALAAAWGFHRPPSGNAQAAARLP